MSKSDRPPWAVSPSKLRIDLTEFKRLEQLAIQEAKAIDAGYLRLAEHLAGIKKMFDEYEEDEDAALGSVGHKSFVHWASNVLGWDRDKAYRHQQVWDRLICRAGMKREDIADLPWTKAHALSVAENRGLLETRKQQKEMLTKAKELPHDEFKKSIRQKAQEEDPEGEMVKMEFKVTLAQKDNIERALHSASKMGKLKAPGALLDLLALEFNASYAPTTFREAAIHSMASRFEEAFGVKLVIYHPDKGFIRGKELSSEIEEEGKKKS